MKWYLLKKRMWREMRYLLANRIFIFPPGLQSYDEFVAAKIYRLLISREVPIGKNCTMSWVSKTFVTVFPNTDRPS